MQNIGQLTVLVETAAVGLSARELRIGRPELPREYDDGGLVDVNRVPGAALTAQLGLTQQEMTNVIAAYAISEMTHGPGTLTGRTPVTVKVLPSGLLTLNVFALTCRTTEAEP